MILIISQPFEVLLLPQHLISKTYFSATVIKLLISFPPLPYISYLFISTDTELAECKRSLRAAKEQENIANEAAAALRVTVETNAGLISRLKNLPKLIV